MTRSSTPYARGADWKAPDGYGFNPDIPVAGYYKSRLRAGGIAVGIRIWFGAPLDPVTGEEMDRGHRWQAEANGKYMELEYVWPKCADSPCDKNEYNYLCNLRAWGERVDPTGPVANPTKRLDHLSTPMMF
jgi:hypothetical protein